MEDGDVLSGEVDHRSARQCRICCDDTDGDGNERLFRPCLCKGSLAYVHVGCLDTWRRTSANPQSRWRCDVCRHEYAFRSAFGADRLFVSRVLSSPCFNELASLALLAGAVFLAGFGAKAAIYPEWRDVFVLDWAHWVLGASVTGVGSVLGWIVATVGPFHGLQVAGQHAPWHYVPRGGGARNNDSLFVIILAIVAMIGLGMALAWIHGIVKEQTKRALNHGAQIVLEVAHDKKQQ